MKKIAVGLMVGALFVSSLSGCASIVSKSQWPVTVQSNPSGAKCVVAKKNGVQLHSGETPMTLTLNSSAGYFSKAEYTVNCNKDGFKPSSSEFSGDISGWYLLGNLGFGGLVGWLIVDPASGAMWKLEETHVVNMASLDTQLLTQTAPAAPTQAAKTSFKSANE